MAGYVELRVLCAMKIVTPTQTWGTEQLEKNTVDYVRLLARELAITPTSNISDSSLCQDRRHLVH